MKDERIKGLIRHIMTMIGGILIAFGLLTADTVDILTTAIIEIIGGVMSIWGFIASWKAKPDDVIAD